MIIEDVINDEQCVKYREACEKYLGKPSDGNKKIQVMPDGPTKKEEFWSLINNKKILEYVKEIVAGPIVYTQHSDLHINLGTGAFHRDARNKRFNPQYALIDEVVLRVALYLSDSDGNRGGLLVIPNSHKKQSYLQNKELSLYNRVRLKFRQINLNELMPQFSLLSTTVRIFPKPGSIIIFDQSIVHAGMRPPQKNGHKYSIFWSYGSKSDGKKAHVDFYRGKKGYLQKMPDELKDLLNKENVDVY